MDERCYKPTTHRRSPRIMKPHVITLVDTWYPAIGQEWSGGRYGTNCVRAIVRRRRPNSKETDKCNAFTHHLFSMGGVRVWNPDMDLWTCDISFDVTSRVLTVAAALAVLLAVVLTDDTSARVVTALAGVITRHIVVYVSRRVLTANWHLPAHTTNQFSRCQTGLIIDCFHFIVFACVFSSFRCLLCFL